VRACNLHDDCDRADAILMEAFGRLAMHCEDADCMACGMTEALAEALSVLTGFKNAEGK